VVETALRVVLHPRELVRIVQRAANLTLSAIGVEIGVPLDFAPPAHYGRLS